MTPEDVVAAAHAAYSALPRHGKPGIRSNGVAEWTILAAVVLSRPDGPARAVSLGTGVKCLPAARLPPLGDALHDCHAEVLARRGFVRWLIDEAGRVLRGGDGDSGVLSLEGGVWRLRPGVQVALYISLLPCGDASTMYLASHAEDSTPWARDDGDDDGAARGRAGFGSFGGLRTKPGRPDAPASISLSCSDKIASWSAVGLQGGLLGAFAPVYLDALVVGGVDTPAGDERGPWEDKVRDELRRAIHGRIEGVKDFLPAGYVLHAPEVYITSTRFEHARPAEVAAASMAEPANTCLLAIHGRGGGRAEVLVGGCVNTSAWRAPGTKLVKEKLRSAACRFEMARAYLALERDMVAATGASAQREHSGASTTNSDGMAVADTSAATLPPAPALAPTYAQLKARNTAYAAAKAALRGTPRVPVSGAWRLPHTFYATAAGDGAGAESGYGVGSSANTADADVPAAFPSAPALAPPFAGWIVAGNRYASFTTDGELRFPLETGDSEAG